MVYPLIIRTVGTYLLKKSAKKQLKKDLAQTQRTSEKKLKNTENLGNVDRFTKVGKNKNKVPGKPGGGSYNQSIRQVSDDANFIFGRARGSSKKTGPFKTQSPYSGLTSKTKKQQAPNVLGPAGSYKSPTKRFNQKDIEMAVSNAMKKAKELKGIN